MNKTLTALVPCLPFLPFLSLLLGGCAPTSKAVSDSPQPRLTMGITLCKSGEPRQLKPGESCLVEVRAETWNTRSGLSVCAGQTYRISVPDNVTDGVLNGKTGRQFWDDAGHVSHPLQGESGSGLMNTLAGRKRVPRQNWFVLVAGTLPLGADDDDDPEHLAALPAQDLNDPTVTYTARASGELVFFANDAKGPWPLRKLFYGNNHGHAWVVIRAEEPACVAPAPMPTP